MIHVFALSSVNIGEGKSKFVSQFFRHCARPLWCVFLPTFSKFGETFGSRPFADVVDDTQSSGAA